ICQLQCCTLVLQAIIWPVGIQRMLLAFGQPAFAQHKRADFPHISCVFSLFAVLLGTVCHVLLRIIVNGAYYPCISAFAQPRLWLARAGAVLILPAIVLAEAVMLQQQDAVWFSNQLVSWYQQHGR